VNTDQFVDAIRVLARTTGDLTITVNPASVTGGLVTGPGRNELRFTADIAVQRQNSLTIPVDFGSNVAHAGLTVESSLPLAVSSQLQLSLAFGLNLLPGLTNDQAFFIRPTNFSLGTSVDGTNLSGNAKIGLLASQFVGGSLDLDARVSVSLANIDLDPHGNITLAELNQNPIDVIAFQQTTHSTLSGALPVTATLGTSNL
jgi:hypothetical protein